MTALVFPFGIGVALQRLVQDAEIIARMKESWGEFNRFFQKLDGAFQTAFSLLLDGLFVILHGLLWEVFFHLADVDDVGICRIKTRRPVAKLDGWLIQKHRDAR